MGPRSPMDAHLLHAPPPGPPPADPGKLSVVGFHVRVRALVPGTRHACAAPQPVGVLPAFSRHRRGGPGGFPGTYCGPFRPPAIPALPLLPPRRGAAMKSDGSVHLVLDLSSPRGASVNSGIFGIPPWMQPWPLCAGWGGTHLWQKRTSAMPSASALCGPQIGRSCATRGTSGYTSTSGYLLGPALPPSYLLSSLKRFTGLPCTFAGASISSITSMTIFWCGPSMLRAPANCKLSRTSAPTSVSHSRRRSWRSWSCRHADSSYWASPWTPLFRRCAYPRINLHGFKLACPRGGRGRNAPSACKRELLSLIGVLSFTCKVVRPGRIFLRRLIDLSMMVPALVHHISLTAVARADIAWWVEFLPSWNGRAFFQPLPVAAEALGFATDASSMGLGVVFGRKWLYEAWPPAFRAYHINVLELFAVAVAVHCWGVEWHDTQILLHTDNMPVVQVWATGTCKCPHMSLVHLLFFFLSQRKVNLLLAHVPGGQNINADMLSRLQVEEFRSRACGTLPMPTMVPSHFWEWL